MNDAEDKKTHGVESQHECASVPNDSAFAICQEKLKKTEERLAYLTADFENFRRNVVKERALWGQVAQAKVFTDLLTIVDDFDRAIQDLQNATDLGECEVARFQGFDLINKALWKILRAHNVQEIDATGAFNPEKHEALMQVDALEGAQSGDIVNVLQKGYTHYDTVLRPAKVSVAK